jgi:general secretion pathway protein E
LVFSTLHTNDAASAATRLVDIGIEPYLISSSVIGIVAQRLVRTICPRCGESYVPEEATLTELGLQREDANGPLMLRRGTGCEHCRLAGYRGRTAIYEIMAVDGPVRELIMAEHSADRIRSLARQRGMRTLREAGWEKVKAGVTTVEEVLRVTQDEAPES